MCQILIGHKCEIGIKTRPLIESVRARNHRRIGNDSSHAVFVARLGQGRIADRTKEYPAASDRGIVVLRGRYFEEIKRIEEGKDPEGVSAPVNPRRCVKRFFTRGGLNSVSTRNEQTNAPAHSWYYQADVTC